VAYCFRCGTGWTICALRWLTGIEWPWEANAEQEARLEGAAAWLFPRAAPAKTDVEPGAVDYERLCPARGVVAQAAADAGGLGNVAGLAPLSRLASIWWSASPAQAATVAAPWSHVVAAALYLADRGVSREDAARWGLLVPTDPAAGAWLGRVVFPGWAPLTGRLRGFTARSVAPGAPRRYLAARARPAKFPLLYGPLALATLAAGTWGPAEPVLVEGPMDVVKVEAAGFPSVSLMGKRVMAGALAEFRELGLRRAVLLLDSTGDVTAAMRLAEAGVLAAAGVKVRVARLESGDPGKASAAAIIAAVRGATPAHLMALSDVL